MESDAPALTTIAAVEDHCRRAIGGDNQALEQLLQAYHRRFAGYVARKLGADLRGKLDADDVLQEAYIQFFHGISGFTYEHQDSFYRWGVFLIDRALIDRVRHLRRKKRDAAREATMPSPSSSRHDGLLERCCQDTTTPSRLARRGEALSALMSAIAQLPEQDRAVVRRVFLNEESPSSIAGEMQCTEQWVRRIGARALERLRRKLRASRYLSSE